MFVDEQACDRPQANADNSFNTEHVLEADAMCGVHHWLLQLTEEGSFPDGNPFPSIIRDDVFTAQYPDRYVHLLRWFLSVTNTSIEEFFRLKRYEDTSLLLAPGLSTFRFLVDYALSVPCGGTFPLGNDANPAYRFASGTYGVMPEGKICLEDVLAIAGTKPQEAFAELDDMLGTSRDSWREQQRWIEILEEAYAANPRPIPWVRKEAMRFKMENYGKFLTVPAPLLPLSVGLPMWAHLSAKKGAPSFTVREWRFPFSLEEYQSHLRSNYVALHFLDNLADAEQAEIKGKLCLLHPQDHADPATCSNGIG